jgi:hypothetical protein
MTMPVIEQTIVEGNLTFTFPKDAQSSKYDDWSYYRNQFNKVGSSKAVDIVYREEEHVWLIEVKDYRQQKRVKSIDLADEVALKVRDALAGILAASKKANDMDERDLAKRIVKTKKFRVVLHLEQPQITSKLRPVGSAINPTVVQLKMRSILKGIDAHARVVDMKTLRREMNWTVV